MTVIVEEGDLPRRLRRQAGDLLAREWGADWRVSAHAGPHAPAFRALELNGSGHVVGHGSAFPIPTRPELRLFGIGDLVVKRRYRGRGVARRVAADLVAECERREADVILVDTLVAANAFTSVGLAAAEPWSFFYVRGGACRRHPHWMVRRRAAGQPRIELLAHGDF